MSGFRACGRSADSRCAADTADLSEGIFVRRIIGLLIGTTATAVAFAAPAAADQAEFVRKLQQQYVFLSADQLIATGNKVCANAARGVPAADSMLMVREELGVSIQAAVDIVSLSVSELGC
ncbi:DUF732 domain-containing protein [Mycolicibacterium novocastrense]|uniref:DUF732 domain-containing protein n=1 Tax=Mycolicibacterium novocastrense TaxID=59813 RepID=A0AAW5SFB2_MYCNV|nr:DUF732 domain-containing protein [Mycolicibacterium novocastrense]